MQVHDYTFLFGIGLFFAFMDAYGIGANDVANSFATSVGSGTITLAQALIIACFCEFGGAFLLGASTTETIKGGIVETKLYATQPELLMLTMVCALIGSSTWVLFASSRGWPVSTTHAIVGAITGGGIADGIQWSGITKIVLSWVVSPLASGVVCALLFLFTKYMVLVHEDSFRRGLIAIPVYFGVALCVQVFYIIYKGAPDTKLKDSSTYIGIPVGIAIGVGFAVFLWCFFFLRPFLRRRILGNEDLRWYHVFYVPLVPHREKAPIDTEESGKGEKSGADGVDGEADASLVKLEEGEKSYFQKFKDVLFRGVRYDIHSKPSETTNAVHESATKFDPDTERLFSAVQVVTACFTSFAHGSNDVANAIGPLATIYYIWQNANIDVKKAPVPIWILAFGGAAIDLGLMTYGYHVMRTLGNDVTYMSPTRGFSAELATSITILTCSKLSLPVSSTHCITGATTAIGLCSGGGFKSLNWRLLLGVFAGWVATLPAAGITSGLILAFVSRAPKLLEKNMAWRQTLHVRRVASATSSSRLFSTSRTLFQAEAPKNDDNVFSVNQEEIAKFAAMSDEWWAPHGPFRMLHLMNPPRIRYIRNRLEASGAIGGLETHKNPAHARFPLMGLSILDVGCGGGLLSEALARLGANVTGLDASNENIQMARIHARRDPLLNGGGPGSIEYRHQTADLMLSTMSRTPLAYFLTVFSAEHLLRMVPVGTHDWSKYITPDELDTGVEELAQCKVLSIQGICFNPLSGQWELAPVSRSGSRSRNASTSSLGSLSSSGLLDCLSQMGASASESVNYLLAAKKVVPAADPASQSKGQGSEQ
ncbi:Na+/Pi symporter [Lunasporangiospora selenospora]|uniref:Phosphate transporter n=1 Tax=Lunasporangiospora selenospora TaxID=979761 RepID=A0A9P6KGW5_9FUNG|nr:Na+/Pi symporter [Lunasporangiospora selenospora]